MTPTFIEQHEAAVESAPDGKAPGVYENGVLLADNGDLTDVPCTYSLQSRSNAYLKDYSGLSSKDIFVSIRQGC